MRALIVLLLLILTAPAAMAQLSVAPVVLELRAERPVGLITLTNTGDAPVALEAEVFEWRQEDGETRLLPTERALANPGSFTIAPGKSQALRVGLLRPQATTPAGESSFRLVLQELRAAAGSPAATVAVRIQVTLPVFVASPGAAPDAVVTLTERDGLLALSVANRGTAHLKTLSLEDGRGESWPIGGYVLPGAARKWTLNRTAPLVAPCRLTSNVGPIEVPCPR